MALSGQIPTVRKNQSGIHVALRLTLQMLCPSGLSSIFSHFFEAEGKSLMETSASGVLLGGRILYSTRRAPPSATLVVAPACGKTPKVGRA